MNPRRILFALTLALIVSGACTWVASRALRAQPAGRAGLTLHYAAPSRSLQAGEVLKPESLELVAWPDTDPLDGAFAATGGLAGRELLFPLDKGQPILDRHLSAPGAGTGLASRIPNGMRAVALRSDEVVGVAGFLLPGSHLDVLVTYRSDDAPEPVTATVLQNAVVAAVGNRIEPDPDGKPSAVTVVTLLLTPEEAERAVLASNQGTIHFVLRNGGDQSSNTQSPIALSQLAGATPFSARIKTAPPAMPHVKTSHEGEHGIEMVLGDSAGATTSSIGLAAGATR